MTDIRTSTPLTHCITNIVVANFQANGLLAIGASPIMADSIEEMEDIAEIADVGVYNIGTLGSSTADAMIAAGRRMMELGKPLVLDPVGAGASTYRLQTVQRLLDELRFSAIRCNAGELAAISGTQWDAKGVDAGTGSANIAQTARLLAEEFSCVAAISGEVDLVTDGSRIERIEGGHALMPSITGSGCLLSAVVGASIAAGSDRVFESAIRAMRGYKAAGARAGREAKGPGDFPALFLNALNELSRGGSL